MPDMQVRRGDIWRWRIYGIDGLCGVWIVIVQMRIFPKGSDARLDFDVIVIFRKFSC